MWVPIMLPNNVFKEHNIRYIFGNYETFVLTSMYNHNNVAHRSLDEIAKSLYFSMKHCNVGEKPFLCVCHSMGGIIAKRILQLAKDCNNDKFLENIRGVVFFSTPHFGTDVLSNILNLFIDEYGKIFKVFQTTSNEYGLYKDDILHNLNSLY